MRGLAVILALLPCAALAQDPVVPAFADETVSSGLAHRFSGEWTFMVGGGAAGACRHKHRERRQSARDPCLKVWEHAIHRSLSSAE